MLLTAQKENKLRDEVLGQGIVYSESQQMEEMVD